MSITDELREWIDSVTWLDDSVSQAHKNILAIADRIDKQHHKTLENVNELQELCTKVQEDRERMFRACVEKNQTILRLCDEKAKLRELVHELLTDPDAWDYDYFKYRMRELGIER